MNKERILALATTIENGLLPEGLKLGMGSFVSSGIDGCGTTCCIAGLAVLHSGRTLEELMELERRSTAMLADIATEYLDLELEVANELFYPSLGRWRNIQPQQAVRALRNLAETGVAIWEPLA